MNNLLKIFTVAFLALLPLAASAKDAAQSWPTKDACEKETSQKCDFVMCDYIPAGKTYEEVCGKNFHEGWQPVAAPAQDHSHPAKGAQ